MSKSSFLFGVLLISCFAFTGCGSSPEVVEVEPVTEQEVEDYEAEMDDTEEIEQ